LPKSDDVICKKFTELLLNNYFFTEKITISFFVKFQKTILSTRTTFLGFLYFEKTKSCSIIAYLCSLSKISFSYFFYLLFLKNFSRTSQKFFQKMFWEKFSENVLESVNNFSLKFFFYLKKKK
jgi:hypothetical protein